ncbi:MAG: hypothetical protein ARM1_0758 [Candidatus Micrarchaeota archaeon]|nr:MAG: hypothetical protein ARM1_0758 [Candidatus Micrarchaeota archaeon]
MKAHTAVHVFARSLQRLGLNIFVRKAEEQENEGRIYIKPDIDRDSILKAEINVNKIIHQNLNVSSEIFNTLKEAKERYPELRYNWERLDENQEVRIVKIGDFDVAACSREHESSTLMLKAFSIDSINHKGDETIIHFYVGDSAIESMLTLKSKYIEVRDYLNTDNIVKAFENLKAERDLLNDEAVALVRQAASKLNILRVESAMRYIKFINVISKDAASFILVGKNDILAYNSLKDLKSIEQSIKSLGFKGLVKEHIIGGSVPNDKLNDLLVAINSEK